MKATKRILCVMLALLMCLSTVALSASAMPVKGNANAKYREEIIDILDIVETKHDLCVYDLIMEYNADGSAVAECENGDYALIFVHWGGILCWEVRETIGNYRLNHVSAYNPYIAGYAVYSINENKIYSLHEAWYYGLPKTEEILKMLGTKANLYAPVFEEYFKAEIPAEGIKLIDVGWNEYRELYYYMGAEGGTKEMPEATPDYVLVDAYVLSQREPGYAFGIYGDYVVSSLFSKPDALVYYIYTPADGKIYTLREAFDKGIEGIENVFTDYGLGSVSGDADKDGRLSVKDATLIQKYVAKTRNLNFPKDFEAVCEGADYSPDKKKLNIADFDMNDKINIKDATAIQKKLAKITE